MPHGKTVFLREELMQHKVERGNAGPLSVLLMLTTGRHSGATRRMPKLFGDKYFAAGDPKRVAVLTRGQHHIMELWKDGTLLVGTSMPFGTALT
jgi:hypothetical protein